MGFRKILSILMTGSVLFGFSATAQAVEVKFSGVMNFASEYIKNNNFERGDGIKIMMRFRPQIDFIVNENITSSLALQVGTYQFGQDAAGLGAIGETSIKVRRAFVSVNMPGMENLNMTFGIQSMANPSSTYGGSFVLDDHVAGIASRLKINDMVGLNVLWSRPYVTAGGRNNKGSSAIDYFQVDIPVSFTGVTFTPWASIANITRKSGQSLSQLEPSARGMGADTFFAQRGLFNVQRARTAGKESTFVKPSTGGFAWWVGASISIDLVQNLNIGIDTIYGGTKFGSNELDSRQGFVVALDVSYKLPMFTPGIKYWYISGNNRSSGHTTAGGIMPYLYASYTPIYFAFADSAIVLGNDGLVGGYDVSSNQGVVLELADITFMDKLTHTVQVGYILGTTNKEWVKAPDGQSTNRDFDPTYLTTKDSIFALNFMTNYQIYENFSTMFGVGYMHMITTNKDWNAASKPSSDILSLGLGFQYTF